MALGDIHEATAGETTDLYYVDTEMFDSPKYGPVYILNAEKPAVVDTATGRHYEVVLKAMAEVGIEPEDLEAIILTHVHLDHAGGASVLAQKCPNADVYIHHSGAQFLENPEPIWEGTKEVVGDRIRYYREPDPIPADRIIEVDDGDIIDLGNHRLEVYHAPGHAFHHVVYFDIENDGVFTADAAGINVPDREGVRYTSPPPGFDLDGCLTDVAMIQEIDPTALYYGHFGDYETGELLVEYESVLENWVEDVEQIREELGDDEEVKAYFAEQADSTAYWTEEHARGEERMNVAGVLHYLDNRD